MNIYELVSNVVPNLTHIVQENHESSFLTYDNFNDYRENTMNFSNSSQNLTIIFQQLFSKLPNNQNLFNISSNADLLSALSELHPSSLPVVPSLFSPVDDKSSHRFLPIISLWFVLIINPLLVKREFFKKYSLIENINLEYFFILDFIGCHRKSSYDLYFNQI